MSTIKCFDQNSLKALEQKAKVSDRRRINYNVHESSEALVQRLFVSLWPNTYVCPHRHTQPEKFEFFWMVSGRLSFLVFDDHGVVIERFLLEAGGDLPGLEIPAGCWHCVVGDASPATFFEVKQGPYDVATDKEFASWAPREGDAGAVNYLSGLKSIAKGESAVSPIALSSD